MVERKRSLSTAFEHPAPPPRETKVNRIGTPASDNKENDRQEQHVKTATLPGRGAPLQELVEIPSSGGVLRPKMTLGEDASVACEVEGQWQSAPFEIWEDVDVVAERLALGGGREE